MCVLHRSQRLRWEERRYKELYLCQEPLWLPRYALPFRHFQVFEVELVLIWIRNNLLRYSSCSSIRVEHPEQSSLPFCMNWLQNFSNISMSVLLRSHRTCLVPMLDRFLGISPPQPFITALKGRLLQCQTLSSVSPNSLSQLQAKNFLEGCFLDELGTLCCTLGIWVFVIQQLWMPRTGCR